MNQRISIFTTLILSIFLSTSCIFTGPSLKGNGDVVEEKRKVEDFDEIKVSRGMNVYISQGDKTEVVVKADENLLDAIETRVEGDVLKITTNGNIRKATSNKVYVSTPDISVIKSFAGSNVYSETTINSDHLEISSSAGSNLKLDIIAEKVEISASAGSNIKLEGKAKSVSGKASAGSNLKAEGLSVANCTLKTSSGANIWITVKNNFEGHASSGGNIFYYGNPETTDLNKSSGGNIIKK